MGVEFFSESGKQFRFTNAAWRYASNFAEANGWKPSDPDAEGFTAEESSALADAIERGIAGKSPQEISEFLTRLLVLPSNSPMFPDDPIHVDDKTLKYWREFIEFARAGAMRLEYGGRHHAQ